MFLGIAGAMLTFIPAETIAYMELEKNTSTTLVFQLMGALYLGFAILGWMTKGPQIGGIYNKPFVTGNLMHYATGAFTLLKLSLNGQNTNPIMITLAVFYIVFAIGFLYTFMINPIKQLNG